MAIYPREDARTALPQLEKKFTTMADEFSKKIDGMLDFFYPVGSYYETSDTAFDPNTKWGGTWELELAGQVHVSSGTGYAVSGAETNTTDGGASTVALAIANMPAHNHNQRVIVGSFWNLAQQGSGQGVTVDGTVCQYLNKSEYVGYATDSKQSTEGVKIVATHTHDTQGSGTAHNNMQPYIVVNRWHRVA